MICNNCGSQNEDFMKFCTNCGAPLAAATPAPEVQPEAAPAPEAQPEVAPAPQFGGQPEAAPAPQFGAQPEAAPAPQFGGQPEAAPAPQFGGQPEMSPAPQFGAQYEVAPKAKAPKAKKEKAPKAVPAPVVPQNNEIPQSTKNVSAIAPGVSAGLAGMVLVLVSLLNFLNLIFSIPCSLTAMILSIVGKCRSKKAGLKNGAATAGLVFSIMAFVLAVLIVVGTIILVTVVFPDFLAEFDLQEMIDDITASFEEYTRIMDQSSNFMNQSW